MMSEFRVYRKGKLYDIVFFERTCSKEYVRDSLINHDGYPEDITLKVKKV